MRGIIVYEPDAASQQKWYINEYIKNMAALGHELELVTTKALADMESEGVPADFAVIRTMDPGVSSGLEKSGIRCFNGSLAGSLSADKGKAYDFVGEKTEVPFMPLMQTPHYPLVLKKRFCHGGRDVHYISDGRQLDRLTSTGLHNFIMQQPCDTPGIDVRVYILGGRIRAAMKRINPLARDMAADYSEKFRSNFCLGGKAEVYDVDSDREMKDYVNQILAKLPLDFGGLDFIFHGGHPVFNEIESVAGARMLYAYTDIDIVKEYCHYISESLKKSRLRDRLKCRYCVAGRERNEDE